MSLLRFILIAAVLMVPATAQQATRPNAEPAPQIESLIQQIRKAVTAERWLDAAQTFDRAWLLLHEAEDVLINIRFAGPQTLRQGQHQSAAGGRAILRHLIRTAPPGLRDTYERQFGATARIELKQMLQVGNRNHLATLAARWEHCKVAEQVVRQLSEGARARGANVELALILRTLIGTNPDPAWQLELATALWNAGLDEDARYVVRRICERVGYAEKVDTGDSQQRLPAAASQIDAWFSDSFGARNVGPTIERTFRDPHTGRSEPIEQGTAFQTSWQSSLFQSIAYPQFAEQLDQLERFASSALSDAPIGPGQPVVTDELVIVQAAGTIQAIDRTTGEIIWESGRFNRQLKSALKDAAKNTTQRWVAGARRMILHAPQNHLRGQFATDGELLFCIEETSQGVGGIIGTNAGPASNQSYNLLRAYDINSGVLRGQAGGRTTRSLDEVADPLSSMFFLGAPLLLGDRILVMAEDVHGLHLLDLRLKNASAGGHGELEFVVADRQLLATPRHQLQSHPLRRLCGIRPALSNGLIICQPCNGHVLALTAGDLSIQWIHRYQSSIGVSEFGRETLVIRSSRDTAESTLRDRYLRPHDSNAKVVGSRMLVMPRDSDQILCLDLTTGAQLWSRPRNQLRYFAGLSDSIVVLAQGEELVALDLADGHAVWQRILSDVSVSGQPVWTAELGYLPTDQGQLITFSLATGRELLRQTLLDSPVGNLTTANGQLLTQTDTAVNCWTTNDSPSTDPLSVARRLLVHQEVEDAIQVLSGLADESDPEVQQHARRMLMTQLLESLRLNYTDSRRHLPQLRRLIKEAAPSPLQIAKSLSQSIGMTLLDAAELPDRWQAEQANLSLRDTVDQLVLEGMADSASLPVEQLAAEIAHALRNAMTQPDRRQNSGRIRRFAALHSAAEIHRMLDRLDAVQRNTIVRAVRPTVQEVISATTDPNLVLHQVRCCWMAGLADCLTSAQISDQLPQGIHEAFRQALLADVYLNSETSSVTATADNSIWSSEDGISMRETLMAAKGETSPGNDPVGRLTDLRQRRQDPAVFWPVEVKKSKARSARGSRSPVVNSVRKTLPFYGTPGAYRGWQFVTIGRQPGVHAIDGSGQIRWNFDTSILRRRNQPNTRRQTSAQRQQPNYVVAAGRLLTMLLDNHVVVLDGTGPRKSGPQVIRMLDLNQFLPQASIHQANAHAGTGTGMYEWQPPGLAPLGPITEFGLPLFRGDTLFVLNPWTGADGWMVDGLPDDCRLLASGDQLSLISVSTGQIQVRDMRDGSVRGKGPLPEWWEAGNQLYETSVRHVDLEEGTRWSWRVGVEASRCLMFSQTRGESTLQCYDMAKVDRDGPALVWQEELPENCVYSNVANGRIATLSDDQQLQIRQLSDGRLIADQQVAAAKNCERLYLRESNSTMLALTWCPDRQLELFPSIGSVLVHGPIYALNARTGQLAWTGMAEQESMKVLNPDNAPFPPSVPLLTLLRRHFPNITPGRPIRSHYSARILDVTGGRVLYQEDNVGSTLSQHAVQLNENNSITVSFNKRDVTIEKSSE